MFGELSNMWKLYRGEEVRMEDCTACGNFPVCPLPDLAIQRTILDFKLDHPDIKDESDVTDEHYLEITKALEELSERLDDIHLGAFLKRYADDLRNETIGVDTERLSVFEEYLEDLD